MKERFIPKINSYRILSPKDPLVIHDLFDLFTKIVLYGQEQDSLHQETFLHMRYSVGHEMVVLGLEHLEISKVWIDPLVEHRTFLGVLSASEYRDTERLLSILCFYRHRLALLPETWRSLIEGHPVLGTLKSRLEHEEIVPIADSIIGSSMETIKEMDNISKITISKSWN